MNTIRTRHCAPYAYICVLLLLAVMVGCGGSSNHNSSSNNNGSGGTNPGSSNPGTSGGNGGGSSSATYVYLGNATEGGGAFAYKLDASGNPTAVSGSPFITNDSSAASYGSLAVANGFVYVSNLSSSGPGTVIAMQIDPSTGALTQKGSAVSATDTSYTAVRLMVASPDGKAIYAVTQTAVTALSTSGGTPTVLNSQTLSDGNVWAFAVSNGVAYVGIQNGNPKTGFAQPVIKKITLGSNGSLVDAGQTVATLADANIPMDLAADANGKYLAVTTGLNDSAVTMFSIGSDGSLTPVAGSPFVESVGLGQKVSFDPSGKFLYEVTNEEAVPNSENVIVYSVGSNGALTQLQALALPANVHVTGLKVTNGFVFISNEATDGLSGTVTVLTRDASTGKLTMAGTGNANKAVGQVGVSQ